MQRSLWVLLLACLAAASGCGDPIDAPVTEPSVASTVPADGDTGVGINTSILVDFAQPMDRDNGRVRLNPGLLQISHLVSEDGTSLVAAPGGLEPNTAYTVTLSSFTDEAGVTMPTVEIRFETGAGVACGTDVTPPALLGTEVTLVPGAPRRIDLVFSEAVEGDLAAALSIDEGASIGDVTGGGASWSVDLRDVWPGVDYVLTLGEGVADVCGNPAAGARVPIHVPCDGQPAEVLSDKTHRVGSDHPPPYALLFSEGVLRVALNGLTFAAGGGNGGSDVSYSVVEIAPDRYDVDFGASDWQAGDRFTLQVRTDVVDFCGNPLRGNVNVEVEVIDCASDTSPPLLLSPTAVDLDLDSPAPIPVRFDEAVVGLGAALSMRAQAGSTGTDLRYDLTGGGATYALVPRATDWADGDVFLIEIGAGAGDVCGNELAPATITVSVAYVCAQTPPPEVTSTGPFAITALDPTVTLTFDSDVVVESAAAFTLAPVRGSGSVAEVVASGPSAVSVTLAGIVPGDAYDLTVGAGAVSEAACGHGLDTPATVRVDVSAPPTGESCAGEYVLDGRSFPHAVTGVFTDPLLYPASCSDPGDDNVFWASYTLQSAGPALNVSVEHTGPDNTWLTIGTFTSSAADICDPATRTEIDCAWGNSTVSSVIDVSGLAAGTVLHFMIHGDGESYPVEDPIVIIGEDCGPAVAATMTLPSEGEIDVPVTSAVVLSFDGAMAPGTGTVDLLADGASLTSGPFLVASPPASEYFVSLSETSLVISPITPWPGSAVIEVVIDLADLCGRPVTGTFSFSTPNTSGPNAEGCADAITVVNGANPIPYIEGASLDVLDATVASCAPGYAGTADSVFQLQATGTLAYIGMDIGVPSVGAVLDACDSTANVLGCAMSSSGTIFYGIVASGLVPGSMYTFAVGNIGPSSLWPARTDPTLTVVQSLGTDAAGVAQVTDGTGATTPLSLPLQVDYGDDESFVDTTASAYRSITVAGATRVVVFGHIDIQPQAVDALWVRDAGGAFAYFWGERDFAFEAQGDTAILSMSSDASVSSLTDPTLDGYTITSVTHE